MSTRSPAGVDPVEKRIIAIALLVAAAHLGIIAYAAIRLGIGVPDCVRNVQPFSSPSFMHLGGNRYEIHVVARMWGFEPGHITLPTGSVVDFYITSRDVTHGFDIDGTNVNLMAEPFVVNEATARFARPGTYHFLCHEYCGIGHQAMNGVIEVRDDVSRGSAEGLPASSSPVVSGTLTGGGFAAKPPGRQVMERYGCVACHSVDGSPGVGPSFKGIWGTQVQFNDGSSMTVDPAYIKMHIQRPGFKVVKGFSPVMPKLPVTDDEIKDVTEYIKSLK